MRPIIFGVALAAAVAATLVVAPSAQAQAQFPVVTGVTPFSPEANYMSRPGYLRYRHFVNTNNWISYEEAARIVAEQGG